MTRVYIFLIGLAAIVVSITGAFFSVTGLAELFAGAFMSVIIMASSLEFSKFVVVGFLYRYWGHIPKLLRSYLLFAVVTLMTITSLGIYGYLSNAYQISSIGLHSALMEIDSLEQENQRIQLQVQDLMSFVDQIPNSRISKKFEFQREYEPKILDLRKKSENLVKEIFEKRQSLLSLNTKVGPIVHLSKVFGWDIDTTVNYLILIFVLVFDPFAVSLVFSLNLIIRLQEKYRNNEYKIGAHSFTSPVDHRFKKPKKAA